MDKKRFLGIASAFLLTAVLIIGQGTLSAKEITKEDVEEEQKLTEAASAETEPKEKTPNTPKIGGGGSKI